LEQKDEVLIVDVPRSEWEAIAAAFYLKLIRLRWNVELDAIHGRIGHFKTPLDFPVPRIHDHKPDPVCRGRKSKPLGGTVGGHELRCHLVRNNVANGPLSRLILQNVHVPAQGQALQLRREYHRLRPHKP
jgi:hypothetical protein